MTYDEATAWLEALIDYEKAPDFRYGTAFKLDRVVALMEALGHPERAWPAVHIGGTKGKGSVATYLDALLRAHGKHTGLYTSPHLTSFRERIRIAGRRIEEALFAEIISAIVPWAERWHAEYPENRLSFFDVLTAAAFEAFRRAQAEWAVVEVGMGGRLDATNVVHPRVVVITPIAREHTKYLGETIAAIAGEKAGIVKPGASVLIMPQTNEARAVLQARCAECDVSSTWLEEECIVEEHGERWTLRADGVEYSDLHLRALGRHQRQNFAAAVMALHRTGVAPDVHAVRAVAEGTIIPGRLELVEGQPPVLLDVAHTPESARVLVQTLEEHFAGRRTTLVFSCAADKRIEEMAEILAPAVERVILVQMRGLRAMPMERMLKAWRAVHPYVVPCTDVAQALANARDTAPPHGLIVVCGSFILVGETMKLLGCEPP